MNDIIKFTKSLENSGCLIDGATKTKMQEMKKQESRFPGALLEHLVASLVKPVISSVVKGISRRGVIRARHCVKSVRIWSYSGQHFPAFGLNTKRYSMSLRIQSKWGKIWTRISPNTDTFYAVGRE